MEKAKRLLGLLMCLVVAFAVTLTVACTPEEDETPVTVTISKTAHSLECGETFTLTASASDESAITWTSSDNAVASVAAGVVTALKKGSATITASATGGAKAECVITVLENVPVSVELTESNVTLVVNMTADVGVTLKKGDEVISETVTFIYRLF